jgi:hypothetical protein
MLVTLLPEGLEEADLQKAWTFDMFFVEDTNHQVFFRSQQN